MAIFGVGKRWTWFPLFLTQTEPWVLLWDFTNSDFQTGDTHPEWPLHTFSITSQTLAVSVSSCDTTTCTDCCKWWYQCDGLSSCSCKSSYKYQSSNTRFEHLSAVCIAYHVRDALIELFQYFVEMHDNSCICEMSDQCSVLDIKSSIVYCAEYLSQQTASLSILTLCNSLASFTAYHKHITVLQATRFLD